MDDADVDSNFSQGRRNSAVDVSFDVDGTNVKAALRHSTIDVSRSTTEVVFTLVTRGGFLDVSVKISTQ